MGNIVSIIGVMLAFIVKAAWKISGAVTRIELKFETVETDLKNVCDNVDSANRKIDAQGRQLDAQSKQLTDTNKILTSHVSACDDDKSKLNLRLSEKGI